ncbi:hypothetical protein HK097_006407 [Rhizophlyctis rosea]|uniref:TIL domain-containing protein n=1 Tax=Rhizophlyctis rosea TaxID=64517 RepID=A0AAD5SJ12_9FUNG|nr:hypothetical protein HK097_006407 [Rhizophlyctis rosea]
MGHTTAVPITTTTTTNIRPTTTSTPSCSSESGKVYTTCGSACPASCATYGQPIGCAAVCVAGCFCPSGTVDFNGRCVKPTECPKTTTTTTKAATTTTKATTTTSAPTGFPTTGYGDVPLGGQCNTSEPFTLKCAYPYDCSYFNGRCVEPSRATTKRNGETCLGADLYNRPCNSFYDCVPSTLVCVPYESSGINFKSVGEVCGSEDRHNRPCVQGARCDAGKCVRQ